jgi:hypothetical protein
MSRITSQGTKVVWGGIELRATSVTYSASAGDEIDITSLASVVVTDPNNSYRRFVQREFDACFSGDAAEVTVEFFAAANTNLRNLVGYRRQLTVNMPETETGGFVTTISNVPGFVDAAHSFSGFAVLGSVSYTATVGDYVRGSATFRMTG